MVNTSTELPDGPPDQLPCAISLVLKDMGNGVTRVLHAAQMGEVPPPEFFAMFRPTSVSIPLIDRVSDALEVASASLGLDPKREYVGGYMRALTDNITEFFIW
ncbi:hypothetical protein JZU54_05605 [bacterium]|nr:hypothetical protein [bacterium]